MTTSANHNFADKVALVTGAGSGIGRATAMLLSANGATCIVCDFAGDAAEVVADEIANAGGKADAVTLDVASEQSWRDTIELVTSKHNRLDIVVNNAGISISKPIAECTLADWRRVMAVNLDGAFLGTRYAIGAMSEGGSIVNVASVSGITPSGGAAAYCSSKAAVRMLTKTAAIECADAGNNLRVNLVTPGGVRTPMWEKEPFFVEMIKQHGGIDEAFAAMEGDTPSHQFFTPEEVANTIAYLASDESAHLTGVEIVLDRGHSG